MQPIFSLTTDFGDSPYVGQVKAVLIKHCPLCRIVDVTHAIRPQDIVMGALALADSIPHFPDGSIHIAVVDPGVGTSRKIAVAHIGNWFVVGPDNGLLTELAKDWTLHNLIHVDLSQAKLHPNSVSNTFHGRDIMAPIAARIALKGSLDGLGTTAIHLQPSLIPEPIVQEVGVRGCVISSDSFGNLITNIRFQHLSRHKIRRVQLASGEWIPWVNTYGDADSGALVALLGSSNRVELSIVNGNASKLLSERTTELEITW